MMAQGQLFPSAGGPARSRRKDPSTSKLAAESVNVSGVAQTHVEHVVKMVTAYPGRTACELAELIPEWEMQEVRRRLTDAKKQQLVVAGDPRHCRIRGTKMITWRPA